MLVPLIGGGLHRVLVTDSNRLQFQSLVFEQSAGSLTGLQGDRRGLTFGPTTDVLYRSRRYEEDEGSRRISIDGLTKHGREFRAVGRLMRYHKEAGQGSPTLQPLSKADRRGSKGCP